MNLKWYGHASFRITAEDGTAIVTDPYDPQTSGYRPVTEPADLVVMSSRTDGFHSNAHLIPGKPEVVDALELARGGGRTVARGIPIRATAAMEALKHHEHEPEPLGMYRLAVDGIEIGHLGDVGNPLDDDQLAFFRGTDVLLALAGGFPTILLKDLARALAAIRPRLIIPMHFRTLRYKPANMLWLPAFLEHVSDTPVDFACSEQATLRREDLPEATRVLVLDYA